MPFKLKAWLKAKLGFPGPVPYKTLAEEEDEVEPVVTMARGRELFILVLKMLFGPKPVISASNCLKSNLVSGCLDHKFGHISHCLNTIKCTYSTALQWLFGLQV
ncbi:hypothetical protein TNIN_376731 [Trichonephila inaurata madagascariensis]|uniref:Uncharacterized protein n=1 Tax=Trichonephila inaurata madagascariensis TaxID=2747483 RepID=A0A8X6X7T0_9ARAC|nr:hypothetical protein TNIN_376731 [Trichonephila inaurata madagascariensis]